jgi:YjbE family integral membrane protein
MLDALAAIGGIVLVDLALSGDNALVIGAAAAELPRRQRQAAILVGGTGAILLRIICAAIATVLLQLPLLEALGGLLLLLIAWRLLTGRHSEATNAGSASARELTLRSALLTILVADITMSLDNVLAVGALAHGDILLLAGGLLLSMALLLAGSALVAALVDRLPWLIDVAALVLGWTAANLIVYDGRLASLLYDLPWATIVIHVAALAFVLGADIWLLRARVRRRRRKVASGIVEGDGTDEPERETASSSHP